MHREWCPQERASERRMLTALQRSPLRVGMADNLAQLLPWGGRCLDCGAILTEIPQLTKETSWSRRSLFLKFVRVHKEDVEESSWSGRSHFLKFVRIHKEDAKETSLSRRSFFLKFVCVYKEDTDDSWVASWRFIRINWEINTYYFGD